MLFSFIIISLIKIKIETNPEINNKNTMVIKLWIKILIKFLIIKISLIKFKEGGIEIFNIMEINIIQIENFDWLNMLLNLLIIREE